MCSLFSTAKLWLDVRKWIITGDHFLKWDRLFTCLHCITSNWNISIKHCLINYLRAAFNYPVYLSNKTMELKMQPVKDYTNSKILHAINTKRHWDNSTWQSPMSEVYLYFSHFISQYFTTSGYCHKSFNNIRCACDLSFAFSNNMT